MLESFAVSVAAVDGHVKLLRQALAASSRTMLIQADVVRPLPGLPPSDLIIALDVLEHVDEDVFLRTIRSAARDDAVLLLSVPAFPFLWSAMDVRAGHRARYTLKTLSTVLARTGWRPLGFTHYQFLLFPVVCASRMIASFLPQEFEQRPGLLANMIFGTVNRLEVALLSGISLPFGSSLLLWAKKEAA